MEETTRGSHSMRTGTIVILVLGVLTAIEFVVAITLTFGLLAALAVIAVIKTWFIADYFMHFTQLWRSEE